MSSTHSFDITEVGDNGVNITYNDGEDLLTWESNEFISSRYCIKLATSNKYGSFIVKFTPTHRHLHVEHDIKAQLKTLHSMKCIGFDECQCDVTLFYEAMIGEYIRDKVTDVIESIGASLTQAIVPTNLGYHKHAIVTISQYLPGSRDLFEITLLNEKAKLQYKILDKLPIIQKQDFAAKQEINFELSSRLTAQNGSIDVINMPSTTQYPHLRMIQDDLTSPDGDFTRGFIEDFVQYVNYAGDIPSCKHHHHLEPDHLAIIMGTLCLTVSWVHQMLHISHNDIKVENVVSCLCSQSIEDLDDKISKMVSICRQNEDILQKMLDHEFYDLRELNEKLLKAFTDPQIARLIDFEMAQPFDTNDGRRLWKDGIVGGSHYIPDFEKGFNECDVRLVDTWSVGVTGLTLISGVSPTDFFCVNLEERVEYANRSIYRICKHLSNDSPGKRCSLTQAFSKFAFQLIKHDENKRNNSKKRKLE